jgi:hypothetical protein
MKSTLKGKILSVEKVEGGARARLIINALGKVENDSLAVKHDISLDATVFLKGLVADDMKIGATLTITITDEER